MKTKLCLLLASAWMTVLKCSVASEADVGRLAAANNAFAFNLVRQLSAGATHGSIFVSPYSAATALQMVANGASGQTKMEMQKVLETSDLSAVELNAASRTAADWLNSNDTNIVLSTANALWYRQGAAIKPEFLK